MSAAEITQLQQLPTEEKLQLIDALWESMAPEFDEEPLSEAQTKLLDERLKADLQHPEQAIGLEELMKRVAALRASA